MVFRTSTRKHIKPTKHEINDNAIKQVSSATFLDVTIDNKLNRTEHINLVKYKSSKGVGILNKAKRLLTRPCLVTLYYSFLFPHLTYCIEVWGGAFDSYCSSIIKVKKKAVKMLVSANILAHTKPIFKLLNILMFRQLYVYSIQMFMCKYNSGLLPVQCLLICLNLIKMFIITIQDNLHKYGNFRNKTVLLELRVL